MKQMLGSIELPKLHGRSNTVRALHRRGNRLIAGLRSNVLVEVDIRYAYVSYLYRLFVIVEVLSL